MAKKWISPEKRARGQRRWVWVCAAAIALLVGVEGHYLRVSYNETKQVAEESNAAFKAALAHEDWAVNAPRIRP